MRRSTLITLGSLLTLLLIAAPARAQIGFGGGLNFNSSDDLEFGDAEATFENSTGYHIGVFYDFAVGPLGIRPGIFYRDIGSYEFNLTDFGADTEVFDLSMIEIPIDLRYRIVLPLVKPYLLAGPVIGIPQSEGEFDDDLEDFTFTANVGLGVELSPPAMSLKIMPEIRYAFGVSSFVKEDIEIGDVATFTADDSPSASAFMLRLNVVF